MRLIITLMNRVQQSRKFRQFPQPLKLFVQKYLMIPVIRRYMYEQYIDAQLHRSGWSRNIAASRFGLEKAFETLLPLLNRTMTVLDIGCGDGYILDLLQPHVALAFGLDYHFSKLQKALECGNPVVQADIHYLPISSESIDIIHLSHVLEHAIDKELLLKEMHRILQPQGKCLIVVPSEGEISIKHPSIFSSPQSLAKAVNHLFIVERLWIDHTREPEYWAICTRK